MYNFLIILHLLSLFAWFAGLFYLPRLFVYHTMATQEESKKLFTIMETKLYKIIMNPAMILVIISGLSLIYVQGNDWFKYSTWLHLKLIFVILLIGFHHWLGREIRRLPSHQYSEKFYRCINEFPTLILIIVVTLAKLKTIF